jgi:hypothetical protein
MHTPDDEHHKYYIFIHEQISFYLYGDVDVTNLTSSYMNKSVSTSTSTVTWKEQVEYSRTDPIEAGMDLDVQFSGMNWYIQRPNSN